jgi:ABC-type enterobactin transport system permease subunit
MVSIRLRPAHRIAPTGLRVRHRLSRRLRVVRPVAISPRPSIAFVALAAPQIAQRLTRTAGIALVPSAFIGALVLAVSDIVAQYALPDNLPVGLVTVVVGGGYLVWLLIHEVRRRR